MAKISSNKGLRPIKEIIPGVMEKIKNRRNKIEESKFKDIKHDASMVKDELIAIRKKIAECLVVHIDNARKKFPLDDDSLILNRVEVGLADINAKISHFLEGA